jgi:Mrp family chromosome partitioning ATPase
VITLRELLIEPPASAEQPRVTTIRETPIREQTQYQAVSAATSVHEEQIQSLVRQLFFRNESKPVRHVGFAPVEASTATATLCLEIARALAEEGRYDVGLIDANPDAILLQTQLQIPSPNRAEAAWPMAPRLSMVPRQSWLPAAGGRRITEQNLSRLRELTMEFDFSILWCAPVSWLTASIGQTCDGLVLVLTANKTRRLVAAQMKDELSKAQVPLLGTVLAERRFPVPQGLYRSL